MLLCIKTLHCSSRPVLPLPGRMLFTTAMNAVPSLQLGPKSLTCFDHWLIMFAQKIFSLNKKYFAIIFPPLLTSTPSWRETWAWTHCSSAFLAPSFHFSCALRTLPSRTEQYRFNSANIFQEEQIFSHLSESLRLRPGCWRIRGAPRWGWWTSGPASPGLGCSPQSGETWVYKKLSFGVKIY